MAAYAIKNSRISSSMNVMANVAPRRYVSPSDQYVTLLVRLMPAQAQRGAQSLLEIETQRPTPGAASVLVSSARAHWISPIYWPYIVILVRCEPLHR